MISGAGQEMSGARLVKAFDLGALIKVDRACFGFLENGDDGHSKAVCCCRS